MRALADPGVRYCPKCGKDLTTPQPEHHLPPGTVVGGKYMLGAALGEGGFGITYVGKDTKLNLLVAVKEFYPYGFVNRSASISPTVLCSTNDEKLEFFEKGRARFLQEAQMLARFSGDPGIVDVRDFFEENNTAYIVMEFLEGETLKDRLKKHGSLAPDETLRLLSPVMRSLSRLHKENLIHRDVSPDNIMLTENGVKLLDFGAARFFDGGDKSLSVMLKPGYAPIEQYQSRGKQGPWTDVYALSATVYRCVTGARVPEATERLMEDTLQAPSALGVEISPALEQTLMKGLAVRPDERLQSVDELLSLRTDPRESKPSNASVGPPVNPVVKKTTVPPQEQKRKQHTADHTAPSAVAETNPSAEKAVSPEKEQKATKKNRISVLIFTFAFILILVFVAIIGATKKEQADLPAQTSAENSDPAATVSSLRQTTTTEDRQAAEPVDTTVAASTSYSGMPQTREQILAFYKSAVDKVKSGAAGYEKKVWQNAQMPTLIENPAADDAINNLIDNYMVTDAEANVEQNEKGSEEAIRRIPGCTLTDMSKIKNATCAMDGSNYAITIVLVDETSPATKQSSFLSRITDNFLTKDEIDKEIANIPVLSGVSYDLIYQDYTISATITPDGRFVKMLHHSSVQVKIDSATILSIFKLNDKSATVEADCAFSNFTY